MLNRVQTLCKLQRRPGHSAGWPHIGCTIESEAHDSSWSRSGEHTSRPSSLPSCRNLPTGPPSPPAADCSEGMVTAATSCQTAKVPVFMHMFVCNQERETSSACHNCD